MPNHRLHSRSTLLSTVWHNIHLRNTQSMGFIKLCWPYQKFDVPRVEGGQTRYVVLHVL